MYRFCNHTAPGAVWQASRRRPDYRRERWPLDGGAGRYLFVKQTEHAFLGAAFAAHLIERSDQSALDGQDRLHAEQRAHDCRRGANAPTLVQVFQRAYQEDNARRVAHLADGVDDLFNVMPGGRFLCGADGKLAQRDGHVLCIHDRNARIGMFAAALRRLDRYRSSGRRW